MVDVDPVEEALELLRQKQRSLIEEVNRVEEAITALEKLSPKTGRVPSRSYDPNRPSVRTKVVALLEEAARDWSAGEIIAEYRRRAEPIQATDPSNALRAALADAKKKGMVVSTAVGRYKAAKWQSAEQPDQTSDGTESAEEVPP